MTKSKPFVQVACVCERFLQEPDKVISVIRVVDLLTLTQTPIPTAVPESTLPQPALIQVMDFSIVVALKSGDLQGQFRLSIVMEDPKGTRIPLMRDSPVLLKGDDGVNAAIRFGLPYNAPVGRYWFDVLWDDDVLTRIPFRLKRADAPVEEAAPKTH
jgi:hypothetical protein